MKRLMLAIVVLIISLPVMAGYKLVFQNGAVLDLKEKPDLTLRLIQGETLTGKAVIFPARLVDISATQRLNDELLKPGDPVAPKPEPGPSKSMERIEPVVAQPSGPELPVQDRKEPLVITNDTIPASDRKPESDQTETGQTGEAEARRNVETGVEEGVPRSETGYVDSTGRGESYWRSKFQNNRNQIQQTEKTLQDVQLELNRLASERIQTDDEVYRRQLIGEIQELEKRKKTLQDQLAGLKQEKQELKEQARRSGALPGWYRDYVD